MDGQERSNGGFTMTRERRLQALLTATRLGSQRVPLDLDDVARLRAAVLEDNHLRYLRAVPAYLALARDVGLTGPRRRRSWSSSASSTRASSRATTRAGSPRTWRS
jgi:hypothetical protein